MISGEHLAAYAAGEADPALVARIESALPDDPELAARLERIRAVDRELAAWSSPRLDDAGAARLMAAVDADLASLATDGAATDAAGATASRPGGATGAGAVPVAATRGDRARRWFRDLLDGLDVQRLAGATAVLVLVVGIGAVVVSGGIPGFDVTVNDADSGEAMRAESGGGPEADDLGAAEGAASAGSEAASEAAASESAAEAMTESGSEAAATAAPTAAAATEAEEDSAGGGADAQLADTVPVVDDGRVVADIDDIDSTELRDRLMPLVEMSTPAPDATATSDATTEAAEGMLADGQVRPSDVATVDACRDRLNEVLVAELVTLAPDREAILYVMRHRVVVVAADTCRRLEVVPDR